MRKYLIYALTGFLLASCGKGGSVKNNDRPSVTTTFITNITPTGATVSGSIVNGGGSVITNAGFQWDSTGLFSAPHDSSVGTGSANPSLDIGHLTSGTVWYVRAYAANNAGTTYANVVHFTTDTFPTNYTVITIAGSGSTGFTNGPALSASFNSPLGVAIDRNGVLYVADGSVVVNGLPGTGYIRRIGTDGAVSTFATIGRAAQDVVTDTSGNVYDLDIDDTLYKVTPAGIVTPLATGLSNPISLDIDNNGNIYVTYNRGIGKITSAGVLTKLPIAPGTYYGIAVDRNTNLLYVSNGSQMERLDTLGDILSNEGIPGFSGLTELRVDKNGNVFGTDPAHHQISQFKLATGISPIAGNGVDGDVDGSASRSNFNSPVGLAIDAAGNIFVSDIGLHKIKKLTHK